MRSTPIVEIMLHTVTIPMANIRFGSCVLEAVHEAATDLLRWRHRQAENA